MDYVWTININPIILFTVNRFWLVIYIYHVSSKNLQSNFEKKRSALEVSVRNSLQPSGIDGPDAPDISVWQLYAMIVTIIIILCTDRKYIDGGGQRQGL